MNHIPEQSDFQSSYRTVDPTLLGRLGMAWRHRWLIVLSLVVGLVLGSLFYAQRPMLYRSTAQLYVIKKTPEVITGPEGRPAAMEDDLSSHLALIKSHTVVQRALDKPEVKALSEVTRQDYSVEGVINALSVIRDKDSVGNFNNIFNMTFQGGSPEGCRVLLEAVIQSYQEFLNDKYKKGSVETEKLITQARDVLQNVIEKKEAEYKEFRVNSPLVSFKGKNGENPEQDRLATIETRRIGLEVRRAEVQGHLARMQQALKDGEHGAALMAMSSDLASKSGPDGTRKGSSLSLEDQLFPLLIQEQDMLQQYGPDHPKVKALRNRIETTRRLFTHLSVMGGAGDPSTQRSDSDVSAMVQSYTQSLKQELNDIDASEKSLSGLFDQEHAEAKKLNDFEFRDEEFHRELGNKQKLYDSIIDRLQQVDLVKDMGGYDASVIAPASPGKRVGTGMATILALSAFLGMLGGLGLASLAEMADKSFRSPEEIRRRLGLPVVGHLPFLKPEPEKLEEVRATGLSLSPTLWAFYWPQSPEAEAFRGVRTALYFSTHGEGLKVIQVTSPNKGDGKTTLLTNLGVSIAQSGKTVVLIDCDFRRPRLHKIFGVSGRLGLASVIAGEAELQDAVQPTAVPGLAVLPCGPIPANPAELLTLPRFQELLEAIRMQYDFVLVDTPPLLAVTDPCMVATRVDAVLLNMRVTKNGRQDVERAKEILDGLEARILGITINGVDGPSSYGYKYYQYDKKYQYGYYKSKGEEESDRDVKEVADEIDLHETGESDGASGHHSARAAAGPVQRESPGSGSPHRGRGLIRRLFLG